jgi:hypothetical protein
MKTLIAALLVAGALATTSAQAAPTHGQPAWAQQALTPSS